MRGQIDQKFRLTEHHTNIRQELLGGLTTFIAMAYVLATIPNMLGRTGMDPGAVLTSMVILVILSTWAMGLYTNRPFALAPGLGSTGIVASMILNENIPQPVAAGVIFWSGVLFILISWLGLREAVVRVIPVSLKHAVSAGIGLFIALLGANSGGVIAASEARNCLAFGALTSPEVRVTLVGFIILLVLKARNVRGAPILSILAATLVGILLGVTQLPEQLLAFPSGGSRQLFSIDLLGALRISYLPFLIALFIPDFFSTFGTVYGVGAQAGFLDAEGNMEGVDRCFKVDAVSTSAGALFGIPSMTTYLECSAGIEAGGRTGLTSIFIGLFFLLSLFLSPVALIVPSAATAPILIYIGVNMLGAMRNIKFEDMTEAVPAFLCVAFTVFANNVANGICIAIPAYLIVKLAAGKRKEVHPIIYALSAICLVYFGTQL